MPEKATSPAAALRRSVREATITIPGAPLALAARLIEREGFEAAVGDGCFGAFAGDFFLQVGHEAGEESAGDLIADFLRGGVGGEGARRQDEGDEKRADGRRGDHPYRGAE